MEEHLGTATRPLVWSGMVLTGSSERYPDRICNWDRRFYFTKRLVFIFSLPKLSARAVLAAKFFFLLHSSPHPLISPLQQIRKWDVVMALGFFQCWPWKLCYWYLGGLISLWHGEGAAAFCVKVRGERRVRTKGCSFSPYSAALAYFITSQFCCARLAVLLLLLENFWPTILDVKDPGTLKTNVKMATST